MLNIDYDNSDLWWEKMNQNGSIVNECEWEEKGNEKRDC